MSRFARSVPVLADLTGLPIFARMQESGEPLPMAVGMYWTALDAAFKRRGGQWDVEVARLISEAMRLLGSSRRYRHAVVAPGSMRHDADGNPVEPVKPEHRARVVAQIRQVEKKLAKQGRRQPVQEAA